MFCSPVGAYSRHSLEAANGIRLRFAEASAGILHDPISSNRIMIV